MSDRINGIFLNLAKWQLTSLKGYFADSKEEHTAAADACIDQGNDAETDETWNAVCDKWLARRQKIADRLMKAIEIGASVGASVNVLRKIRVLIQADDESAVNFYADGVVEIDLIFAKMQEKNDKGKDSKKKSYPREITLDARQIERTATREGLTIKDAIEQYIQDNPKKGLKPSSLQKQVTEIRQQKRQKNDSC